MSRVLVLYAHPDPSRSTANESMRRAIDRLEGIELVDLYARYPRFRIDVAAEQQRLLEHDVIVLQFPVCWYSIPALLKEWLDAVLEFGFAYGSGGDRLAGKILLLACTAGGSEAAYATGGRNHFPIRTLLTPLEQTARLCRMQFLPPVVLFSTLQAVADRTLTQHVRRYEQLLVALREDRLNAGELGDRALMFENDSLPLTGARR